MKELQEQQNEALTAERLEEIGGFAAVLLSEGDDWAGVAISELLAEIERLREGQAKEQAQWVPLSELRPGAIFETRDGKRYVKRWSGCLYEESRVVEATSLEGGTYTLFRCSNLEMVREIVI